jgi:hypothetical protein
MKIRHRIWRRRLRVVALPACCLALAIAPAGAAAQSTDLRSPDTRDAAREALADRTPSEPSPTVVHTVERESSTLAVVLASAALGTALVGVALGLAALLRRSRPRWTAG